MLCETYLRSRDTELEHPPHVIYDYLLISPEIAVLQMNEQNRGAGRGASECAFQRKRV